MSIPDLPVPRRMAGLPRDRHGRVVPWFVAFVDGQPDHRIVRPHAWQQAHQGRLCWLCGSPLGLYGSFVIGPMCVVNRIAAEPPSHSTCAEYSVQTCPFLTTPNMVRRTSNLPATTEPDGIMCRRNPGVAVVYTTQGWSKRTGQNLISMDTPYEVSWWAEGRRAMAEEIRSSLESGMEILREHARQDTDPLRALALLHRQHQRALTLLGAAA